MVAREAGISLRSPSWRFRSKCALGATVVILIACLSGWAQIADQVAGVPRTASIAHGIPNATLQSRVDLVLVNVSVYDNSYRAVEGLRANDFALLDSNRPQQIRYISNEDEPLSMVIVFDASGSMTSKIQAARYAIKELIDTSNPQDEFSLITVSAEPRLLLSFDDPIEEIQTRTTAIQPDGYTALWDGIYLAVQQLRNARHQRKALIVISDGEDNHSRYGRSEVKSALQESDAEMYAIGTFQRSFLPRVDQKRAPLELDDLASVTGGRLFAAFEPEDISKAMTQINRELRSQYVLGYYANPKARDGKWHKITVRLSNQMSPTKLHVHSKKGYYAAVE
jgi:Ca-activated chloride channel homolog